MATQKVDTPENAPEAAREFVRLFYEAGHASGIAWGGTRWLGVKALKLPLDLWTLQEIVFDTRPDLVIETGVAEGGSTLFFASLFDLLGSGEIVAVDSDVSRVDPLVREHPRVTVLEGSSTQANVRAHLEQAAAGKRVMVDLDSDHGAAHVLEELRALAPLVSPGCYLVVEDTVINDNPVEDDFGPGPAEAIARWMEAEQPFDVDRDRENLLASFNHGGYLRRRGEDTLAAAPPPVAEAAAGPTSAERDAREIAELRARLADRDEAANSLSHALMHTSRLVRELRLELAREPARTQAIDGLEGRIKDSTRREAEKDREIGHLEWEIARRDADLHRLQTRLDRIHTSLPMRIMNRVRGLPPFRWIFARRAEAYWRDVGGGG